MYTGDKTVWHVSIMSDLTRQHNFNWNWRERFNSSAKISIRWNVRYDEKVDTMRNPIWWEGWYDEKRDMMKSNSMRGTMRNAISWKGWYDEQRDMMKCTVWWEARWWEVRSERYRFCGTSNFIDMMSWCHKPALLYQPVQWFDWGGNAVLALLQDCGNQGLFIFIFC